MQSLSITADTKDITLTMDEASKTWCSARILDDKINVAVTYNPTQVKRKTNIILSSGNNTAEIVVTQDGIGSAGSSAIDIPLGGNSYVTAGTNGGIITDAGFNSWNSTAIVFSTFFRVNRAGGDLKLYLKYRSDAEGNVIMVRCKGKEFEVSLPKAETETAVFLGSIEKVGSGYIRVDFQGKTLKGVTFALASSLQVSGTATESMNYVGDFSYYWGRRGPSVHMTYTIPAGETAEWFYNEVTVPEGLDPIGSYFMANGFNEGYFGIQVNSATERRVLFSVWSPSQTDDPSQIPEEDRVILIKKGEGVTVNDFGNEGSGGQSYLTYNWKSGNTYKFINRIRPIENGYSEYTAYFYAPESDKWRLIAQWKRPKIQTYYQRPYSFLENFNNNTGHITRKAYYRNQWVYTTAGKWVQLVDGRFTVDATGGPGWRMDYKGGMEENGFFLQNCGFFDDYVTPNSAFQRKVSGRQPDINWGELK
ncbi:hypothetical protein FACS1894155_03190 [Bacteroidia bacterium]|nr:hypothetical protein FACS1894155_03190 [Bacteroidia bacterium]